MYDEIAHARRAFSLFPFRGHSRINYGIPLIYAVIMNLTLRSLLNYARESFGDLSCLSANVSSTQFATHIDVV